MKTRTKQLSSLDLVELLEAVCIGSEMKFLEMGLLMVMMLLFSKTLSLDSGDCCNWSCLARGFSLRKLPTLNTT